MKSSKLMDTKRETFYITWTFFSLNLSVSISGKWQMYRQTEKNPTISQENIWLQNGFNAEILTAYLWNLFPKKAVYILKTSLVDRDSA